MATAREQFHRAWETPSYLAARLGTVDHKEIGIRYMVTAFVFLLLGGLEALLIRVQLAVGELEVVSPEVYNQLFTMHGTTMVFLFVTPMLSGFGNYLIPLHIGARDMAFPRLNSFGYWVFLFAGVFMYSSFLIGAAPNGGWFAYAPLTDGTYSPHANMDFWLLGLIFLSVSTTAGAINFIVTILKLRAPGMGLGRLSLFAWAMLGTSAAIIVALPALTVASVLMSLDRQIGTAFFQTAEGGNVLLWQHLFWIFGHPDVYIMLLPAVGIVSTVLPAVTRRPIVGYELMVVATVLTATVAFGVWVHHMFAVGFPLLPMSFFSAASLMIVVPSGIQVFGWLATIWYGRPQFTTAMLFVVGFLFVFVVGGLTGPMLAAIPFDWQVTDSFFVVAHFHYVNVGGTLFPIFAGLYFWVPKMTGRMLSERVGRWVFWLMFLGFNLTFLPMHVSGLLGMPRRVYTYERGLGWDLPNVASSAGALALGAGILLFITSFAWSMRRGAVAPANPWAAPTLEWALPSPPPPYNFERFPVVNGRYPLWGDPPDPTAVRTEVAYLDDQLPGRQTVGSSVLDAAPLDRLPMPQHSLWPLTLAFGMMVFCFGAIADQATTQLLVMASGAVIVLIGGLGWLTPTEEESDG